METIELDIQAATEESFQPYGALLRVPDRPSRRNSFYGDAVELYEPPAFISDDDTCLSIVRLRHRANEVIWMERHFKHTQVFIPLSAAPWAIVVAPANESAGPDPEVVRAFSMPPATGFMLHRGTWHEFPFALAGHLDLLVILRNETNRNLEARENGEAVGGDLEKRNVQKRLNKRFVLPA